MFGRGRRFLFVWVGVKSLTLMFLLTFSVVQADEDKKRERLEYLRKSRSKKYVTYVIDSKFRRFISHRGKHLTISEECGIDIKGTPFHKKCQAMKALTKATTDKLTKKDRFGGKEPGAVMCKKYLGGKIIFAHDRRRNSIALCSFDDDSLVATSSLTYYGRANAK